MGYRGSITEYDYSQAPTIVGSFGLHLEHFAEKTKKLAVNGQPRVLEFGAGTGLYVNELTRQGLDVYGFDISSNSMSLMPPERKILNPADLKRGYYEGVFAKDVLEHCGDLEHVFSLFAHILVSSGILMVVFRNIYGVDASLLNEVNSSKHRYYPINTNMVKESAKAAGISITEQKDWKPRNKNEDWYYNLLNRKVMFGIKA